jgi:hypothetical protein
MRELSIKETRLSREGNIELLRVIAMLFIVSGHFVGQGKLLECLNENTVNDIFFVFFGFGHRVAVNIFLIIGVWFMVDTDFKGIRLVKMHSQVLFYTVPITVILFVLGYGVGVSKVVQACMPILGRPLWFASAYMILLLLSPYLKKVFLLPKDKISTLVGILFLVCCVLPMLTAEMDTFLDNLLWFIVVYIFIGYIKKYVNNLNRGWWLLIGIGIYVVLCTCKIISTEYSSIGICAQYFRKLADRFLHDIKSIPNFLCALCVFGGVHSIKIKYNRFIKFLADASFSVYIVHQVPVFFNVLWEDLLVPWNFINRAYYPLLFLIEVLLLYVVIASIDTIRAVVFNRYWMVSRLASKMGAGIDKLFGV